MRSLSGSAYQYVYEQSFNLHLQQILFVFSWTQNSIKDADEAEAELGSSQELQIRPNQD